MEETVILIYKNSDIAWVGHTDPCNELYKYQVLTTNTPICFQAL